MLSVFLLTRETSKPEDALDLDARAHLERIPLKRPSPFAGVLYVDAPVAQPPGWQAFVNSGLIRPLNLKNRHASAVLFVGTAEHWFALPFGFGRHLLNPECIERSFGLRVTLNSVDPALLRSIDTRTVDEMTVQTRRQASRSSSMDAFGVDVTRDILGGVTGRPRDTNIAPTMTGADPLVLQARMQFSELGDLCKELLGAYSREDYRQNFPWIDHMRHVKEAALRSSLDDELVATLKARTLGKAHLAAPDQIAWANVAGFRYSIDQQAAPLRSEIDLSDYLDAQDARRGVNAPLVLKRLHEDRVSAHAADSDQPLSRWPIYRCVVFETVFAGNIYVLSGGLWYEIERTYADEVARQVHLIPELPASDLCLPVAEEGEYEGDYVQRAAPIMTAGLGVHVEVLDRKLVRCAGASSDIEVCDLLTELGQFIHVKRRTRSSTLSHLFAQGTTSAEAFVGDPTFRQAARARIPGSPCASQGILPDTAPKTSNYSVIYAIVAPGAGPLADALPFLSRVNLSSAFRRLRSWGYEVALVRVDEQ